MELTDLFKKFVALVKNKDLKSGHREVTVSAERKNSAWGTNHNMGCVQTFEKLNLSIHGLTTINYFSAQRFHKLGETNDFILNLIGKLSGVAQNHSAAGFGVIRNCLQNRKNKDSCLSHA